MKNSTIALIIGRANRKEKSGIILEPISELVFFSKVKNLKGIKDPRRIPYYEFYFIKNKEEKVVAAVLDMGIDLHWYVLKKYRGEGHLTNSLKQSILPHLFTLRESQKLTIEGITVREPDALSSERVALKCGFKKISAWEFELDKADFLALT